ncbi:unnamed protein product, partial [Didymodactylos carnosus]
MSTSYHHQVSSHHYQTSSRSYVSPLVRLERRNLRFQPKKVKLEQQLAQQCDQGELTPFRQPVGFACHFIHRNTNIHTINKLIDAAQTTTHFTIDTENDILTHAP